MRRGGSFAVGVLTATLALGLCARSGRAGDDVEAARDHYQKGKRAYDVGHFAEAAKEYELAYAAKDDPALLFNLGQAHRLAGHRSEAILAYKAYLRNAPNSPNRAKAQHRIRELEATPSSGELTVTDQTPPAAKEPSSSVPTNALGVTASDKTPPAAKEPSNSVPTNALVVTDTPEPRQPVYKKWWLWTVVGVVATGAVVGGVVAGTQSSQSWANAPTFGPGVH